MTDEIKLKISIDFDDTLSIPSIQKYAKMLIEKGVEVWIVTSRFDDVAKYNSHFLRTIGVKLGNLQSQWDDLFVVADKLGIDREHIVFTNMQLKCTYFKDHPEFIWHLDDLLSETTEINKNTEVKGINWIEDASWKNLCNRLLDN